MTNEGEFLTVAATPTAEQSAVARAPIGVSDQASDGRAIAALPDLIAAASGDHCAATASGTQGAATASGYQGKVQGSEGSALFLVHRDSATGEIKHVWAGIAGRGGVKVDTFYSLGADGLPFES